MFELITASDVVRMSLTTLWANVFGFLPRLFAAIVVLLVGWLVAVILGKFVWYIIKGIQLDKGLESLGVKEIMDRSGYRLNTPLLFYELVKWFFIIVFVMAATNILGLTQVSDYLGRVVLYLPNVFVAAFILIIGVLLANFLQGFVRGSIKAAHLRSANALSLAVKWIVLVFSVLVALSQLGVADEIIRIVITGIVAGGTIAFGLAFGLGGKDHAEDLISNVRKHIKE